MEKDTKKMSSMMWKSTWLTAFFSFAIVFSIGASFYKYFFIRDYPIQAQDVCDPVSEKCFVYHCDTNFEECSGDPVADTSYYKIVERNAKNIPLCDPTTEGCTPFVCPEGEEGCVVTFCEPSEGVECSDPAIYSLQVLSIEGEGVEWGVQEVTTEIDGPNPEEALINNAQEQ